MTFSIFLSWKVILLSSVLCIILPVRSVTFFPTPFTGSINIKKRDNSFLLAFCVGVQEGNGIQLENREYEQKIFSTSLGWQPKSANKPEWKRPWKIRAHQRHSIFQQFDEWQNEGIASSRFQWSSGCRWSAKVSYELGFSMTSDAFVIVVSIWDNILI